MPTNSSRDTRDAAEEWERDWRVGVNKTLTDLSKQQQETANLMARISERLSVLEGKPAEQRAQFMTANTGAGTLIAVISLLVAILSVLLNHISFH